MKTHDQLSLGDVGVLLFGIPCAVLGLAKFPLLTGLALAGIAWYVLRGREDRMWLRLFLWAAVFGTAGEAVCVCGTWWTAERRGLWVYAFSSPFGWDLKLPIWLPLVWGDLFMLFVGLAELVIPGAMSRRLKEAVRLSMMLALVAYAGVLFRTVDVRILWLFTPFFAAFVLYWNRLRDLVIFGVAAVLGSLGEILAMRQGLWIYTKPLFTASWVASLGVQGIPVSLAMAWGLSAVFLARLAGNAITTTEE